MIRDWVRHLRKYLVWSAAWLLAAAGTAQAQSTADLKARLDAQARELQELQAILRTGGVPSAQAADDKLDDTSVKKLVDAYVKQKDDARKQAVAEAALKLETEGFQVGSELGMTARWDYFGGLVLATPNKDFTFHVGGLFHEDAVWFTQSPGLKSAAQFGDMQDGTFFRRTRLNMNGTLWQVFEYNVETALEQVKEGIPTLPEMYVGMKDIPFLGTIRVGHQRVPQGLEGDQVSGFKSMTFLEKSYLTDALFQGEFFAPGVLITNSILDQHMTWALDAYRQEFALHNNDGADFGDGKYGYTGRLTYLPIDENEGRHLLHVGVSGSWRRAENPDPGLAGPGVVRFRARPLMRDQIGDYGTGTLPGNAFRLVDTGNLTADSTAILGTELFYVCGPLSLQAEWAYTQASNVVSGGTVGDRSFHGGYVQASYFLTGEYRTYDRRLGRLDPNYFSGPNTNFWLTRGEDGHLLLGRGAWEAAVRWNYLNLNDGPVRGGVIDGVEVGLNWYLNPAVKVQFEYMTNNRWDMKAGLNSGVVQGFGTRVQLSF